MNKELEILSGQVDRISIRRLNHGFPDTLIITKPDGSRFAFQNTLIDLDDGSEISAIQMKGADSLFDGEEEILTPAFRSDREVKRLILVDGDSQYPVGYVIYPLKHMPIILAPGNIFGSLSILSHKNRGKENGLEFNPSQYVVE